MSAEVIPFNFETQSTSIRVAEIDGQPWFVAKDVADALEYVWNGTDCVRHVPDEWRGVRSVLTPSGSQEMVVLSEQGLYFFLARSDKPKALPFQKWLAGEVLPELRKRGFYGLMPVKDRMKYHAILTRTVKELSACRDAWAQHILLDQVDDMCALLGITLPKLALIHEPPAQIEMEITA